MLHAPHAAVLATAALATFLVPNDPATACDPAALARAKTHYARVAAELALRDVSALPEAARARRADLLAELDRYRAAGDFTRGPDPAERVPVFVDADGRHCAVANLLRYSGEADLVARVRTLDNHAWICDLRADREFLAWLDASGLAFEEAARIQFPGMTGPPDAPPAPPAPPTPGPTYGGPGAPAPGAPGTPGPGVPTGPAPSTPGTGGGMPAIAPGAPATPLEQGGLAFTDWGLWWEFNKLQWLRPRALGAAEAPRTGDGAATGAETGVDVARRLARAALADELESPDSAVRAAAAVAYARAAGPAALPALKRLIDDPARTVRIAALVGLCATGSEEGVHALLEIAAREDEPAPGLRAIAIVLLGAARLDGVGDGVAAMLPALVQGGDDDEAYALLATAAYADDAALLAEAKRRSGLFDGRRARSKQPAPILARATEALADGAPEDVLSELCDALGARDLEMRRAAALALGTVEGGLQPLMTAYEAESEPLARGFALLSIGRHAGPVARAFLVRELERGPAAARPWAALALGVLAEQDDDGAARAALRAGAAKEKVRASRGAYLLALGIARDRDAVGLMREALKAPDAETRSYGAQGLGLIGGEGARSALRALLVAEGTPIVRAAAAQALALQGDPADAPVLLRELENARSPLLRGQIAAALGFHGTTAAVEGLLARLSDETVKGDARAAACSALAIALSGRDAIALGEASAWSNHQVFPGWFLELLQQPL